jgi:hypothetical protein
MQGTPIQELQYNASDNNPEMILPQNIHDSSHYAQYNSNTEQPHYITNAQIPHNISQIAPPKFNCKNSQKEIAKEINDDLDDIIPQNENFNIPNEEKLLGFLPENLRDPLIIFILYMFLSLRPVQEFIGRYVSQINPDGEGKVPYIGVIIYGLLLISLYFIVKRALE